MIFVVMPMRKRSEEELRMLHDRLVEEVNNAENLKHRVLCLLSDCIYDCINDYNSNNVQVVVAGRLNDEKV